MKIVPKDREDDVPAEGIIFYDVRFSITLPDGERQKIIINVEGQRQGRIIGKLEGKLETLKMLVTIGKLALADAAQAANMSPEEFKATANMC